MVKKLTIAIFESEYEQRHERAGLEKI